MDMSFWIQNFKCTICENSRFTEVMRIETPDRFERAVGISADNYCRAWVRCHHCGAALNVHIPDNLSQLKSLASSYYAVDFKDETIIAKYRKIMSLPPEKSDNSQRVLRIKEFWEKWRKERTSGAEKSSKIIDIGAGIGVFLSRFLDEFRGTATRWEAVAVESDPIACEHLKTLDKFEVREEMFPGPRLLSGFSLCTLNKIIEHIDNPQNFLMSVRQVLDCEAGLLYIEVPDVKTLEYRSPSDNVLGSLHYHLHDFKSLFYLLENSGFVPLHMTRLVEPSGKISIAAFATLPSVLDEMAERNSP